MPRAMPAALSITVERKGLIYGVTKWMREKSSISLGCDMEGSDIQGKLPCSRKKNQQVTQLSILLFEVKRHLYIHLCSRISPNLYMKKKDHLKDGGWEFSPGPRGNMQEFQLMMDNELMDSFQNCI